VKRRAFLRSTPAVLAGFAGCSLFSESSMSLTLAIFNHAEVLYGIELDVLDRDRGGDRSEARVYSKMERIDPGGEVYLEDVVEARRYSIEYELYKEDSIPTEQDHFHYIPEESSNGDVGLDIHEGGTLTRR
jgi:hypothetical protein